MRLNSLHLVNFRQHAETRVEFDLGLTGIIGPNGSGKSTLLEAIGWALYGQPAARGTRDSIRFLRAGPRAPVRVELDFTLAGHRYAVVRGLTSAELYLDSGTEPIASSITGVAELLQRRLGMTRSEFFHTYFTGQKELSVMAAMSPTERAQFLSRVLGYDRLRTAQTLVRTRRRDVTNEMAGLRSMLPDAEAVSRTVDEAAARVAEATRRREHAQRKRDDANDAFTALAPQWDLAQRTRDAIQQVAAELRVMQNNETSRLRDLERIDRELSEMNGATLELGRLAVELAPLNEIQNEFRRLEELSREEGRRRALEESTQAIEQELVRFRRQQADRAQSARVEPEVTEALAAKRSQLEETLGTLEMRRTEWVRDRQEAETKRDALRRQWGELKVQRDRVVDLGAEGVCPTCTRVLGEAYRTVLDQLEEQLETIQVDGKYFSTRLEQLQEMPEDIRSLEAQRRSLQEEMSALQRQLAQAQSAVKELAQTAREVELKEERLSGFRRELAAIPTGYDAARHEILRRDVTRLAPLNERVTRLSALIEREPLLQLERRRVMSEVEEVRGHIRALQNRYESSRYSEDAFAELRAAYENAAALVHAADLAIGTASADEAAARDALARAERSRDDMERAREAHDRLHRERKLHDELDRTFSDLRTDLNRDLRPELSELASSFMAELSDGRYSEIELDDEYNVVVLEDALPKTVISGGEEDISNLVLRLAISQMIADRAGQAFSLLVLDEIFGSLDEPRRHNVVQLLRRLQDRFEQVILITHIESVRDELDHVITVDYDEQSGTSVVRHGERPLPDLVASGAALEGAGATDE